jgi:hypothetical protein
MLFSVTGYKFKFVDTKIKRNTPFSSMEFPFNKEMLKQKTEKITKEIKARESQVLSYGEEFSKASRGGANNEDA